MVEDFVRGLSNREEIVSGGAAGVDSIAEKAATKTGKAVKVFPADWKRHGKAAGFIRNQQIVDYCDELVAFWDGVSHGTEHSIKLAREAGKPVTVFTRREYNRPLMDEA